MMNTRNKNYVYLSHSYRLTVAEKKYAIFIICISKKSNHTCTLVRANEGNSPCRQDIRAKRCLHTCFSYVFIDGISLDWRLYLSWVRISCNGKRATLWTILEQRLRLLELSYCILCMRMRWRITAILEEILGNFWLREKPLGMTSECTLCVFYTLYTTICYAFQSSDKSACISICYCSIIYLYNAIRSI